MSDEFVGEYIVAFVQMMAWSVVIVVAAVVTGAWLLVRAAWRLARRLAQRRRTERELARVVLEHHTALRNVQRIGDEARRQIRRVGREGPR